MDHVIGEILAGLCLLLFLLFAFRTPIKRVCRQLIESDADETGDDAKLADIIALEKQRVNDQAKEGRFPPEGTAPESPPP
jgi:hypothetical protein